MHCNLLKTIVFLTCFCSITHSAPDYFLRTPFNFGVQYYSSSWLNINSEFGLELNAIAKDSGFEYDYIAMMNPKGIMNPISIELLCNNCTQTFLLHAGVRLRNGPPFWSVPFTSLGYRWTLFTSSWKISPELEVIESVFDAYYKNYNFQIFPRFSIKISRAKSNKIPAYKTGSGETKHIKVFAAYPFGIGLYYEMSKIIRVTSILGFQMPEKVTSFPDTESYEEYGSFTYLPIGVDFGCFQCKTSFVVRNHFSVYASETWERRKEGIAPKDISLISNLIYQGNFHLNRFGLEPYLNILSLEYFPGKQYHQFKSNPLFGINVSYTFVSNNHVK